MPVSLHSSATALISSVLMSCLRPESQRQMPPPVAQILMASGFSRRRTRTAWRSSHGPSTWSPQGWESLLTCSGSLWESPWPAVRQNPRPVAKMRGPFMTPMFTRSRMAMPLRPISQTVVRPWVSAS